MINSTIPNRTELSSFKKLAKTEVLAADELRAADVLSFRFGSIVSSIADM